ncbi:MAG TPA: toll/interleukin-1 receptor domain-containing protein [Pseudonocardiaceae bacterium]|nr:toll/interleukin-1 receptor domain-containing protein [Pseudonocardiaceae bacterium]
MSYTQADRAWAEWIAWRLEQAGRRVLIQSWDMVPGSNWVDRMLEGVHRAERTIALLSPPIWSRCMARSNGKPPGVKIRWVNSAS